jgi:hypothetical protein
MTGEPKRLLVYPEVTRWDPQTGQRFKKGQWVKARLDEARFIFVGELLLVQQWMEYRHGLPSVLEYGDRPEARSAAA